MDNNADCDVGSGYLDDFPCYSGFDNLEVGFMNGNIME